MNDDVAWQRGPVAWQRGPVAAGFRASSPSSISRRAVTVRTTSAARCRDDNVLLSTLTLTFERKRSTTDFIVVIITISVVPRRPTATPTLLLFLYLSGTHFLEQYSEAIRC